MCPAYVPSSEAVPAWRTKANNCNMFVLQDLPKELNTRWRGGQAARLASGLALSRVHLRPRSRSRCAVGIAAPLCRSQTADGGSIPR